MPWALGFTPRGQRDLARLPEAARTAVGRALERMAENPGTADLAKLGGRENEWRLRVGEWRAILRLDNRNGRISVIRILPRGRAYRR